jgi:hypothetical protein
MRMLRRAPPRSLQRAIVPLGAFLAPDVTACQTAAVRTKADTAMVAATIPASWIPKLLYWPLLRVATASGPESHSGRSCGTKLRVLACGRIGSTVRGVLDFWVGRQRAAAGLLCV